jgi:hypothetical protein
MRAAEGPSAGLGPIEVFNAIFAELRAARLARSRFGRVMTRLSFEKASEEADL